MEYRQLGSSGIKVSEVSLGSWVMGKVGWGEVCDDDSIAAIRTAMDIGMNFIDTAHTYGHGHSENLIGQALEGRREEAVICTKVVNRWDEIENTWVVDCSYDSIMREVQKGLERLRTDYIDVYLIHNYDPNVPIKETMRALQKLLDDKVVRAVGVSRYNLQQLEKAAGCIELHAAQYPFNIMRRREIAPLMKFCREKNIGIMAYASLAKGLLSGKFSGTETFPETDNRHGNPMFQGIEFEKRSKAVEKMRPIAEKYGKTLAQLAINWSLCQPGVTTALVGARKPEQVKDNAGASGWRLTADDLAEIEYLTTQIKEPDNF